jgi:hypothetical protein
MCETTPENCTKILLATALTIHVKFCSMVIELHRLCNSLTKISCSTQLYSEQKLIEKLMSTINSHLQIVVSVLHSIRNTAALIQRDYVSLI